MVTYSLLSLAGIFLLIKWTLLYSYKKRLASPEKINADLLTRLNSKSDNHAQ